MKISLAKQVHYDSGPNMTPLVDVVMVILIFLMLAGSFGSMEHYMASSGSIQSAGGPAAAPPPGWTPPKMVNVAIGVQGEARVENNPKSFLKPQELKVELARLLKELQAVETDPKKREDIECVLRPVEGTRWESLAPIYAAALQAEFKKVSFATTGPRR